MITSIPSYSMYAIQENELAQLRDLTAFLELELNFYHQAVEVLKDTKEGWHDECVVPPTRLSARVTQPFHFAQIQHIACRPSAADGTDPFLLTLCRGHQLAPQLSQNHRTEIPQAAREALPAAGLWLRL